jgi:hypothetical protein
MSKDSIDVPVLSRTQATLLPTLPLTAIEKPSLLLLSMTRRFSKVHNVAVNYHAHQPNILQIMKCA